MRHHHKFINSLDDQTRKRREQKHIFGREFDRRSHELLATDGHRPLDHYSILKFSQYSIDTTQICGATCLVFECDLSHIEWHISLQQSSRPCQSDATRLPLIYSHRCIIELVPFPLCVCRSERRISTKCQRDPHVTKNRETL